MEFKKIKLTKDGGMEIHYNGLAYSGTTGYTQEIILVAGMPPHQDLLDKFESLNFFLADLCEQRDCVLESVMSVSASAELEQSDSTSQIECRGISMGGNDESAGITLIGRRRLKGKKILNLTSPFRKWEDPNDEYLRIWELKTACRELEEEATQYLKGKYAVSPQGDLFASPYDADPDDDEQF